MTHFSYFPNYYSIEDIFVTQEKAECKANQKVPHMGILDPSTETYDLIPGSLLNLPLWYIKGLKPNNHYFSVKVPTIYKNVHKAICEADTTHIELGKLHPFFYEYGRHLVSYDKNRIVGKIIFETMRHRVRYLLEIFKNLNKDGKPDHKLDNLENNLFEMGLETFFYYSSWLQTKLERIKTSEMVIELNKKRKYSP